MTRGKVLYISYDGLTDPLGQSQILPYLQGLANLGFMISIISFEKPGRINLKKEEVVKACSIHQIEWFPLQYHKSPPVLSTLYDLYKLRRLIKRLQAKKDFDIVHCRSYLAAFSGIWMKRVHSKKFIFDMRGFWADERVEGGLWKLSNPVYFLIYKFFKHKEKEFLIHADAIVSLTENAREEIQSWKLTNSPFTIIPTCVDLDLFDPSKISEEAKHKLRKGIGIAEDDFVLLYLGSWGTWYRTEEMLELFASLKKIHKTIKFLIVTSDEVHSHPEERIDMRIVYAMREEVPLYISLAHASVFYISPVFSKKASSATKLGEILGMNVPVITNSGWGDIDMYQRIFGENIMINTTPDLIIRKGMDKTGINSRATCIKYLSHHMGVSRYSDIYDLLINEK